MLTILKNAWKTPDLKKRIIFTIIMVAIFRLGSYIPVPGVDRSQLTSMVDSQGLLGFYDLIAGGALTRFSILALATTPYINASIIVQLLTVGFKPLEDLSKEGEEGRKKIRNITRYLSLPFAALLGWGSIVTISNAKAILNPGWATYAVILLTLITGSVFVMWLGDQITVYGIGNGVSVIIFINIISRFPHIVGQLITAYDAGSTSIVTIILFLIGALFLSFTVILFYLAERRIPVQYAGKVVGNKTYKGQSTHIPIGLLSSAVIAIIFAQAVLNFPSTIAQFFLKPENAFRANWIDSKAWWVPFNQTTLMYSILYVVLVILFSWFQTLITFKPDEMAENMNKSSGFIPGIRPGKNTAEYLERILTRIAIIGGVYAAFIAIFPIIMANISELKDISFGGTMLLILVNVALDSVKQIESQLTMRHYQGFLK